MNVQEAKPLNVAVDVTGERFLLDAGPSLLQRTANVASIAAAEAEEVDRAAQLAGFRRALYIRARTSTTGSPSRFRMRHAEPWRFLRTSEHRPINTLV